MSIQGQAAQAKEPLAGFRDIDANCLSCVPVLGAWYARGKGNFKKSRQSQRITTAGSPQNGASQVPQFQRPERERGAKAARTIGTIALTRPNRQQRPRPEQPLDFLNPLSMTPGQSEARWQKLNMRLKALGERQTLGLEDHKAQCWGSETPSLWPSWIPEFGIECIIDQFFLRLVTFSHHQLMVQDGLLGCFALCHECGCFICFKAGAYSILDFLCLTT